MSSVFLEANLHDRAICVALGLICEAFKKIFQSCVSNEQLKEKSELGIFSFQKLCLCVFRTDGKHILHTS